MATPTIRELFVLGQVVRIKGTAAGYKPARLGDDSEMERVNNLVRQQAEDCIAALEILRLHGAASGLAAGKIARRLMEHFGIYVARCGNCEIYQEMKEFSAWPKHGYPTYATRLTCHVCVLKARKQQPSRQCRSYCISIMLGERLTICSLSARSKNEAAIFFFSSARGFDPNFLDLPTQSYKGVGYDICLNAPGPRTHTIILPNPIDAL